jgi:hypothetical protein
MGADRLGLFSDCASARFWVGLALTLALGATA